MFLTEISHDDLAVSRFGISPINEVLQSLGFLSGFFPDPVLAQWADRKRPQFDRLRRRHPAADVLTALWSTRGRQPDFLAPPPMGTETTVAQELAMVRATPLRRARERLAGSLSESGQSFSTEAAAILRSPDVVDILADGLEAAWHELIEPDWPAIHAILQQDLLYRSRLLLSHGWAAAIADLEPRVRWSTEGEVGAIKINRFENEYHPPDGQGLRFAPTIFGLRVFVDPPFPRTMAYPARGKATLAEAESPSEGDGLERLIGRTRAHLLRALQQPATTTQLTRRHGISLGAVGHHLSALRASGLIVGTRAGQSVVYRRTKLGDTLAEANSA